MKQVDDLSREEKEELLKRIDEDLKNTLSEKRYLHSVSSMKKAKELANEYNEDELTAMLTTLAHDIAKEMTEDEQREYAKKNGIELDDFDMMQKTMLHGKVGADIVAKKYGFTKEMQDAIFYHTTGRANMTLLDKIVFLADKSEEGRKEESADELRRIIKEEGLDRAILWDIDYYSLPRFIEKQKLIHPESIYARNDIILKLKKEEERR